MRHIFASIILIAGDVLVFYGAIFIALSIRSWQLPSFEFALRNSAAFSFVLPIWILIYFYMGLYKFRNIRDLSTLIGDSIISFFIILGISAMVFYLFPEYLLTPKTHLLLAATFTCTGWILLRRTWLYTIYSQELSQRVTFIGENSIILSIIDDLKQIQHSGFQHVPRKEIDKYLRLEMDIDQEQSQEAAAYRLKTLVDLLVVDSAQIEGDSDFAGKMIDLAHYADIPIWTDLDFYEELYEKIPPELASRPVWLLSNVFRRRRDLYRAYIKRVMDILIGSAAFVAGLPFLLLVAATIRFFDGRMVLYPQVRIGFHGSPFTFWKFRTMIPNSDTNGYLWGQGKSDSRVTKVGKILRRFRLDELPQLWNVVKGDMSLVGPRPTWVGEKQAFKLKHYNLRHLVKPGMSGWAQVSHRATDNLEDTIDKLHYDLYYVKHLSFGLDIAILLKTIRRVLQPEQVYHAMIRTDVKTSSRKKKAA